MSSPTTESRSVLRTYPQRLADLAAQDPHRTALTYLPRAGQPLSITWSRLDVAVSRAATALTQRGVRAGDVVGIKYPNCPEHVIAALAIWRVGGTVLVLNPRAPLAECEEVQRLAACALVVGASGSPVGLQLPLAELLAPGRAAAATWPGIVSQPGKLSPTGGSTGTPKLILHDRPWGDVPGRVWAGVAERVGFAPDQTQLVCSPLFHNAPFSWLHYGLFERQHVVLMEAFDQYAVLDAIERYQVNFVMMVPTMLHRLLSVEDVRGRDFGSLTALYHTGGPCAPWLKREWMQILGPERVTEMYGSTEDVGQAIITGPEWLEHVGSVGRPVMTEIRIRAETGEEAPVGEVGEIYLRPTNHQVDFRYLGAASDARTWEGYYSVGDAGRLDEDGYLYLADRQLDIINSGGVRVLPAEVEAALLQHPDVVDAAVIGVPDEVWGRRVHALVVLRPDTVENEDGLRSFLHARLAPEKVPKAIELVENLPRNEFGKLRRSALADARDDSSRPAARRPRCI